MELKVGEHILVQIADGYSDKIYIIKVDILKFGGAEGKAINPKVHPWHDRALSFWYDDPAFRILRKVQPK